MALTEQAITEISHEEAVTVSLWAFLEERRQPWWRIGRRRYLQGIVVAKSAEAKQLRAALEA